MSATISLRQLLCHRSIDGLVLAEIDIVEALVDGAGNRCGMVEVRLLRGGQKVCRAILGSFLVGLLRPVARHDVAGMAREHEVHRHACELERGAALQEQDRVVVRNAIELLEGCLGILEDLFELRRSMAHLKHAHATALVVEKLGLGFLEHTLGHCCRTWVEVEHASHLHAPIVRHLRQGTDAPSCRSSEGEMYRCEHCSYSV